MTKCADRDQRTDSLVGALAFLMADRMAKAMTAATGLSLTATAALNLIDSHPGILSGQLSKSLELSFAGGARVVEALEKAGLVARAVGPADGRSMQACVTRQGKAMVEQLHKARLDALHAILAGLKPQQSVQLARIAEDLLQSATTSDHLAVNLCRFCSAAVCSKETCPVTIKAQALAASTR